MRSSSPSLFLRGLSAAVMLAASIGHAQVMTAPYPATGSGSSGQVLGADFLEELFIADTMPKVFAKFTPPVADAQITVSDYLLLDAPPITLAGSVTVHLLSELPGTDLLLLFNPRARENEASLLAAKLIPPLGKADVRVPIKLARTTELVFFARANGRWYKVSSEVKIAEKAGKTSKKSSKGTQAGTR